MVTKVRRGGGGEGHAHLDVLVLEGELLEERAEQLQQVPPTTQADEVAQHLGCHTVGSEEGSDLDCRGAAYQSIVSINEERGAKKVRVWWELTYVSD
jgi:hypothetical protein